MQLKVVKIGENKPLYCHQEKRPYIDSWLGPRVESLKSSRVDIYRPDGSQSQVDVERLRLERGCAAIFYEMINLSDEL